MKIGDKVIDDLSGDICTILNIQDRNNSPDSIVNVNLIGNLITLENESGERYYVYDWEVSEIKK